MMMMRARSSVQYRDVAFLLLEAIRLYIPTNPHVL